VPPRQNVFLELTDDPPPPQHCRHGRVRARLPAPRQRSGWIKLNTNENPYPPSPQVRAAILAELGADGENLRKYPDPGSRLVRAAAADLYGFPVDWLITANGSDELLNNLIRACTGEGEEIGYVHPSYSYYATLAEIQGRGYGLSG